MVANLYAVYPTLHGGPTWASYSRHNPQFIDSYPASCRLISSYRRAGKSLGTRHAPIATMYHTPTQRRRGMVGIGMGVVPAE